MKAEELRKSILQLAIQGKLVAQCEGDEPASVLLDKIRAEKAQLIKDKKIKKDKKESVIYRGEDGSWYERVGKEVTCIDEAIPFDIPDSWEWCMLSTFNEIYTGNSINAIEKQNNYTNIEQGYPYIGTKDVEFDHSIVYDNGVKIPFSISDNFRHAYSNCILLCIEGGSAGRKIGMLDSEVCFGNKLCCFNVRTVTSAYLYYLLQSPFFLDVFRTNTTGIIGGVSVEKLKVFRVPIPPLSEQKRIVAKLAELEPLLAEYDSKEKELSEINNKLPEELKKSVLQYAIQGKLVEQDPTDEPASILLERIRTEKEQLIKDKKIKRDKNDSIIYRGEDDSWYERKGKEVTCIDSEIPFEIPTSWQWCRLGSSIYQLLSGRDLTPNQYNDNKIGLPYITGASNINKDTIIQNRWTDTPMVISELGDLLITCKGTVGTMAFNNIGNIHIARQIMSIRANKTLLSYISIFLQNYVNVLNAKAKSMIPGIAREDVLDALIPIPPLAEQKRIVEKLNQILEVL